MPMYIHHLLHIADWILCWGPGLLFLQFPMEGMIGYLKNTPSRTTTSSRNSVSSPRWTSIPLTKLAKLLGTKYYKEWMQELILIRTYCADHGKNLNGIDVEKMVMEHWGRCTLANGDVVCSWRLEQSWKLEYFYGKAVVYIRIPETFFDPTTNGADNKLFAVNQLFSKRTNLFKSEILCQWSDEYRLATLDQIHHLIGIVQAEDGEGRTFMWILLRHYSDAVIYPASESDEDKALNEVYADLNEEIKKMGNKKMGNGEDRKGT
ncbi:hypothetical protein BT69DRAFT_1297609 [Atractiella rhizophila]|nr:hypothetical protein BT69DRAFT_1297609 [Atractiella rhizophila]